MNKHLTIRACVLATILATFGCDTVEERREPVTTSTTTTEETTTVHPLRGAHSTQTITTETR